MDRGEEGGGAGGGSVGREGRRLGPRERQQHQGPGAAAAPRAWTRDSPARDGGSPGALPGAQASALRTQVRRSLEAGADRSACLQALLETAAGAGASSPLL